MVTSSELSVTTGIPYFGTLISWTKSGFLKIIFLLKVKKESNYFKLLNHSNCFKNQFKFSNSKPPLIKNQSYNGY